MSKILKSACLFLVLLVFPYAVFASIPSIGEGAVNLISQSFNFQLGGMNVQPSFTPLPSDLSVNYLGQIFGTVGTVLHGTSGQMLGQLFKVFNIGLLVLAGVFLIYTIVMTILNAAHEGEFMGRKWNSAWIAIRTVFGLGLLVPSPTTGYSSIQVFVMWIVIQGAGFANMAWYSALSYLAQGGQIYTPPATDSASMIDLVGNVLSMQVCMYYAQNVEQTAQKNLKSQQQTPTTNTNTASPAPAINNVTDFTPFVGIYFDQARNVYNSVVKFPGNGYSADGQQDNACGQISFGTNSTHDALDQDNKANTLKAAVQQIMLDTNTYAQQMVGTGTTPPSNSQNFPTQVQGAIVGGAADWVNITLPIRTGGPSLGDALMLGYWKTAVEEGWIMAGRFYFALGNIRKSVSNATSVSVKIDQAPAGIVTPNGGAYISFVNTPQISTANMSRLQNFTSANKESLVQLMGDQGVANQVKKARNLANQVDQAGKVNLNVGASGILAFLLDPITSVLLGVIAQFTTAVGDPILILQGIGYTFMILAAALWIGGTIGVFGVSLATSVLSSIQPAGYATLDTLLVFIPIFVTFILIFFVLGANFAYYIPLIPFIIFVFSAVGWLISVIEAMVAAPLVALGVTHPEGQHDLLGKSEQAIMLLLSVFLRPVLMIIGLFAGVIVSRVVLRFLNEGFFGIIFDVGEFSLFAFVAVLIVYSMLLISIVNQAFSLIYVVPDRIMRWIGETTDQTSAPQEALQASKQGFEQLSGGVQQMGGSFAGEYAKKMGPPKREEPKGTVSGSGGRPQNEG
jgi:defect in organelle trafficking protein DotA